MNWRVAVPRPVRRKIAGFNLDRRIEARLYRELFQQLSTAPELQSRIVAPIRCGTWRFVIPDPSQLVAHAFFFWVNDTRKEGVRIVIDADYDLLE